jgi:hypothetical protein
MAKAASASHHTGSAEEALTSPLTAAVHAVANALAALPVPGMLIGGIAVIARGVPRLTRDVGAFAQANQVLLLRHEPSGIDVDLSIAWLPFELDALAASEPLDIAGARVAVARPEDLIIYKAVAFRSQDQQDIERLLVLYGTRVDLARIRRIVSEFAIALDEPGRTEEFAVILRRVGLG